MKKKMVVLHIGMHKTASTFLQDILFPNIPNVTYISRPFTILNHEFNSLQYADESLYDEKEIRSLVDSIQYQKLLISDENFCGKPVSLGYSNRSVVARRLHSLFPNAQVIVFLRNQIDLLYSLYNQHIKIFDHFHVPIKRAYWKKSEKRYSLRDYSNKKSFNIELLKFNHNEFYINLEYFLFSRMINFYNSIFNKVHVFLYEDFKIDIEKSVCRLEEILGEKVQLDKKSILQKRVNSKLDDKELEKKRVRNLLSSTSLRLPFTVGKLLYSTSKHDNLTYLREFAGDYFYEDNKRLADQYPEIRSENFQKYYLE